MADVYNEKINMSWTMPELTAEKDYLIQNQGVYDIQAYVGTQAPSDNTLEGTIIQPLVQAHYKKGSGNLYLRTQSGESRINISEAE